MPIVKAYTIHNNTYEWEVPTVQAGREYAKRITTEGLWTREADGTEVFRPSHQIIKVTILPPAPAKRRGRKPKS